MEFLFFQINQIDNGKINADLFLRSVLPKENVTGFQMENG